MYKGKGKSQKDLSRMGIWTDTRSKYHSFSIFAEITCRVGKKVVNINIDWAGGQYWLKPVNTGQ
jgi:hypothetical protein